MQRLVAEIEPPSNKREGLLTLFFILLSQSYVISTHPCPPILFYYNESTQHCNVLYICDFCAESTGIKVNASFPQLENTAKACRRDRTAK
jgi:hypothetical protein